MLSCVCWLSLIWILIIMREIYGFDYLLVFVGKGV